MAGASARSHGAASLAILGAVRENLTERKRRKETVTHFQSQIGAIATTFINNAKGPERDSRARLRVAGGHKTHVVIRKLIGDASKMSELLSSERIETSPKLQT